MLVGSVVGFLVWVDFIVVVVVDGVVVGFGDVIGDFVVVEVVDII